MRLPGPVARAGERSSRVSPGPSAEQGEDPPAHRRVTDDPGGIPAEDAARDHGSCQHHHDAGHVRPPHPGEMDRYADRLNEAAGMTDAAKMRSDATGDEDGPEDSTR